MVDLVDVDSPVPRSFHLEDFFAVWNKTKHGHEVLAELEVTDALTVTVNGNTTIDIDLVTLHDHDVIIIEAITPNPPPAPVTPSKQAFVTRLYQDLLHRPPETAGLVGFITALDEGQSHLQVAQSIMASHEYQAVEVQGLYHTLLHRNADAGGLAGFTSLLASGATVAQVEDILLASPEYFQVAGGTNAGFVEALYSDLLHRQADAAGAAVWQADLNNGQSRDQVAAGFLNTQEAETVELRSLYQECLHRPADVSGLAGFLAFLHNGGTQEQVVAQMVGSVEYGHAA